MAALGVHQGLSPVLDVVRDYRWGRVEETIGEDPHLVATLGCAYVRGLQGAGVIATLKHFAGYSASRAARNHGPVSMGRRELMDVVLPPFEAAVTLAGVGSVMNSYADVDGVPAGTTHGCSPTCCGTGGASRARSCPTTGRCRSSPPCTGWPSMPTDAGAHALAAGMDVELPDTIGYRDGLVERVRRGGLPEDLIDRSVRRLLTQKVRAGAARSRTGRPRARSRARPAVDLDAPANRALARAMAERSIVLLDAGSALPLLGAAACARRWRSWGRARPTRARSWAATPSPPTCCPATPATGSASTRRPRWTPCAPSWPTSKWSTQPGCAVRAGPSGLRGRRRTRPGDAEVCVALVGDLAGLFGHGTSGEGCDAADLRLPGVQAELLDELLATGTPVVVVVVSGRPYALGGSGGVHGGVHGGAAGLVQAFMPGEEGGGAIAGVLSGRVQPVGRLPVQIPAGRAGSRAPTCSRRSAAPRARASAAWTPPRCSRSARPLLHDVRGGRAPARWRRAADRRRDHRDGPRAQHRRARGRGGGAAVPA